MVRRARVRAVLLDRLSDELTVVDSGVSTTEACRVRVTDEAGRPAQGAAVRFQIVDGPISFPGVRGKSVTLRTDATGACSPALLFSRRGKAVVLATLNTHQVCAFQPYTEGMTHRLSVYVPEETDAGGRIPVVVSAVDHHGDPVRRARLVLSAIHGQRVISGRLRWSGTQYEGTLSTRVSGTWTVIVADPVSGARGTAVLCVRAGAPFRLRIIGDPDPRVSPPYDLAQLRVALVDRFGNALDPRPIRCEVGSKRIAPHALVGTEAQFNLDATGFKVMAVTLTAIGTRLRRRLDLLCAAAWIGDPGLVIVGSRHRSPVYVSPAAGRSVQRAQVTVRYDAGQAKIHGFTTNTKAGVAVETQHEAGRLNLAIESRRRLTNRRFPDGIPIGYIDWECLGEGANCIAVTATMSPETPPWEKCTSQKEDIRQSVCVNFIYCEDDPRLRTFATQQNRILERLNRIFNRSSTIKTCCPFIDFTIHMTGMSAADWFMTVQGPARMTNTDGSGTLSTTDDSIYFGRQWTEPDGTRRGTTKGVRGGCVNFYLVDLPVDVNGRTTVGPANRDPGDATSGQAGFGLIDPDSRFADTVAHELGHAFGLPHDPPGPDAQRDRDELMYDDPSDRTDTKIKRKDDCRIVWENIGTY